jgi:hypothetical protein
MHIMHELVYCKLYIAIAISMFIIFVNLRMRVCDFCV